MASTYSDLKIQLMATGENSGTWGNVTNVNLGTAIEEAITGSADVAFSSADVTLTLTDTNETQTARNLRLNLTGTSGAARNLIVPAIEKVYIVNNGLADAVTVKNSTGTGIAVPAGKTMYVYNDGTNVVDAITHLTSLTTGVLTSTSTTVLNGTTIPASKTLVTTVDTQTLTNKTVSVDNNTVSGIAASSFVLSNASGNIDGSAAQKAIPSGVVVGTTDTQTLTNKTLTSPTINTPSISGATVITDNSSSDALRITQTGSGNALVVEDSTNPDSTPFVVDANGNVVVGATNAIGALAVVREGFNTITHQSNATSGGNYFNQRRSLGTIASPTVVASGTLLGEYSFSGYDGTGFIQAASINSLVDGTPGTNDMPGRLVFSTTADGASSPTERMRIRSDGNIGIGGDGGANYKLRINGTYSNGGVTSINVIRLDGTIPTGTTGDAVYFQSVLSQAAGFNLSSAVHFQANQGTFSGTVTNQYGYNATASLTGATNNYGFYSNIASGTGRWNFYAAGSAANYFAGIISLGSPTQSLIATFGSAGQRLNVIAAGYAGPTIINACYSASNFGARMDFLKSRSNTANGQTIVQSNDSIGDIYFSASDGTGMIPAAQISAQVDGTPGANDMPGRLVFATTADGASNPTERMRIDSAGRVGIGTTPISAAKVLISGNITDNSFTATGLAVQPTVSGTATVQGIGLDARVSTSDNASVPPSIRLVYAAQGTITGGSRGTVTNQFGFQADQNLTGATNNYGFYSNIASGTGRYNFYAAGSAANYFAGNVGIGTTFVAATEADNLTVSASSGDVGATIFAGSGSKASLYFGATGTGTGRSRIVYDSSDESLGFFTAGNERLRIDSSGNVGIGTTSPGGKLQIDSSSGVNPLVINAPSASSDAARALSFEIDNIEYGKIVGGASGSGGAMAFWTGASGSVAERMRIESSGNVLVGKAAQSLGTDGIELRPGGLIAGTGNNTHTLYLNRRVGDGAVAIFARGGVDVGSISVTTTATAYNTSSDYRLKEDVQPMSGNIDRLMALKPVNFAWKADGSRVDGFLAHEAQEVVPEAVTGTKDAVTTEGYEVEPAVLDDDGNVVTPAVMGTREVPDYQAIDQSKLVPLLTAALQDAVKEINTLKAQVAALQGN